jgi:hypothetical protein
MVPSASSGIAENKRNWIQHVKRMPCNSLPRIIKQKIIFNL